MRDDDLTAHQYLANWRIVAYGVAAAVIILAGCLLALATKPSAVEACAQACGKDRFKSWTAPVESWVEQTKGFDNPNIYHPPVPGRCECL